MAVLRPPTGPTIRLLANHAVGRAPTSDLVIADPLCSSLQATISWTGAAWQIRDLNSRNGTWVNGHRLKEGRGVALSAGMSVAFGNPPLAYVLEDDAAPTAAVVDPEGRPHFADTGLLAIPNEDRPEHTLYLSDDDRWYVESADQPARACANDELLWSDGQPWRVVTPTGRQTTRELELRRPLEGAALTFLVSSDEEQVAVDALFGGVATRLEARAHSYLLLTLARRRLRDREQGVPRQEEGWVDREQLARSLRLQQSDVSVQIYRARKQFAVRGVEGASRLVERRAPDGKLRLGLDHIEVVRLEPTFTQP